jgi:large subunit ribosomal protein L1
MKRSKKYNDLANKVDRSQLYAPAEATVLAKETSPTKFDATVEVALRLGVDPRQADQLVRGTVSLPHGTGKTVRVIVFAEGDKAEAAVATPDQMAKIGRIARILGPRGLMPNPKTGTVTPDVAKAVSEIKAGKIAFRVDKHANLHLPIGKTSFSADQLADNYNAALEEVQRLKPASSKGVYIKKVTVSTTMGPGIPVDPQAVKVK